jgi:hypothetical protein
MQDGLARASDSRPKVIAVESLPSGWRGMRAIVGPHGVVGSVSGRMT